MIALSLAMILVSSEPTPSETAWSYYCWAKQAKDGGRPAFKIAMDGSKNDKHRWLITWPNQKIEADTFKLEDTGNIGGAEGITWLAKDGKRNFGGIYFFDVYEAGASTMLTINIGESPQKGEKYDCIPKRVAVNFAPSDQPDY